MANTRARLKLVPAEGAAVDRDPSSLFRAHSAYVARIAFRLLGRDDEVDDVVQDVFIEAMRRIHEVRELAALRGWLATVTVRASCRRLRLRKLWAIVGLDRPCDPQLAVPATQEQQVFVAEIYRALDRLPVLERVAWVLRHVEGHALDEVAEHCR